MKRGARARAGSCPQRAAATDAGEAGTAGRGQGGEQGSRARGGTAAPPGRRRSLRRQGGSRQAPMYRQQLVWRSLDMIPASFSSWRVILRWWVVSLVPGALSTPSILTATGREERGERKGGKGRKEGAPGQQAGKRGSKRRRRAGAKQLATPCACVDRVAAAAGEQLQAHAARMAGRRCGWLAHHWSGSTWPSTPHQRSRRRCSTPSLARRTALRVGRGGRGGSVRGLPMVFL